MILIGISVFAFILRLVNITQSFWLDEAAQVIESHRPLWQQLDIAGDFHPPLFHLLLHFWMLLGTSELWIRLLSVLFGVGSVYLIYLIGLKLFSRVIGYIAAFLLAINPFHIWYSQEARPYSLTVFLGLLCTYFLIKKQSRAYIFSSILFLYSTYLSPFLFLGQLMYVWVYEKKWLQTWFINMGVSWLFFIPWLPSFFTQLNIGSSLRYTLPGWSEAVSTPILKSIPLTLVKFTIGRISFVNKYIYAGLVGTFILLFATLFSLLPKKRKNYLTLMPLAVVPIISAFIVSLVLPVLAPQRVLFTLPFFILAISFALYYNIKLRWVTIVSLIGMSLFSIAQYATNPQFQREQWREAVRFVEEKRTSDSLAVFVFPDSFAPWQWYSHNLVPALAVAPEFTVGEDQLLGRYTSELQGADRIFYFQYLTDLTDPQHHFLRQLSALGFLEKQIVDFPGVGFIHIYEKALANR